MKNAALISSNSTLREPIWKHLSADLQEELSTSAARSPAVHFLLNTVIGALKFLLKHFILEIAGILERSHIKLWRHFTILGDF